MDETATEIEVTVLLFAKAHELVGKKECKICVPRKLSSIELFEKIIRIFELDDLRNQLILAVNENFLILNDNIIVLSESDKIAVIPPLSGGVNMEAPKNFVKLQQEELNVAEIIDLVTFPNCGAISNFIGVTRDSFEDKKVIKLQYEAYEPMALKEMTNICTEIRSQWNDVEGIAIYHRIGEVPISKASVVIAVSSPHREESLRAVEYAINVLKTTVPIWKKEIYETGQSEWKENKECTWTNISNNISKMESEKIESVIPKKENSQITVHASEELHNKVVDPNFVQICASSEELGRRIEAFVQRKRLQVNNANVEEFCCHNKLNEDNASSCARVDAILIRRKDSKSHMKVHRVFNTWGPQTVDQSILRKANSVDDTSSNVANCFPILDDRISTTERVLGINKPVPTDIYKRLKNIEDRILYLEGISPEYKEFWVTENIGSLKDDSKFTWKRTYSTAELDSKLYELEDKYPNNIK